MDISILKDDKNEVECELSNSTVSEILRVYLNENGADFAAWRRVHPSKPVTFLIKSDKSVKKAVSDSIAAIKKDCNSILNSVKK